MPVSDYSNLLIADLTVTLEAYMDKYTSLLPFLKQGATGTPASDAPSPEQTSKAISLRVRLSLIM
jgi:hypothetical protein